jgi:hypothetical protein
MTSTAPDGNSMQIPILFSDPPSRTSPFSGYGDNFGIWSCRFSADGNEVVAGGSGKIFGQPLAFNLVAIFNVTKTQFTIYWPTREQSKSLHTPMMLTAVVGQILTLEMSL